MSVRTWITLSVAVLVALVGAFAWRFLSPVDAPSILLRADDVRIEGVHKESYWTQRDGAQRTIFDETAQPVASATIRTEGTLRVIVAYPIQPDDGEIVITDDAGDPVMAVAWADEIDYSLDPGTYRLRAEARYPDGSSVTYLYAFNVA